MTSQVQKAKSFRKLHVPSEPLILFNIWDPGSATAVGEAGAKALATSSWAVSESNGYTDGEHTPLAFVMENLRRIVEATELPVTVDLESGYGNTPKKVGETIGLALKAGAIGCNLEDSFPENGSLRKTAQQVDRIRQARQRADEANVPFFINARTDVFIQVSQKEHNGALVAQALERAHAYAEAERFDFRAKHQRIPVLDLWELKGNLAARSIGLRVCRTGSKQTCGKHRTGTMSKTAHRTFPKCRQYTIIAS